MEKITRKTKLEQITKNPKALKIMLEHGLHCVGCLAARFETLEQGAKAHGMSDKEIDEMLNKINS